MLLASPPRIREKLEQLHGAAQAVKEASTARRTGDGGARRCRGERGRGRARCRGAQGRSEFAADRQARRRAAGRRYHLAGERHPHRVRRAGRHRAVSYRRRVASCDDNSAQGRSAAHLAHQDRLGPRHCRPAPAAGRSRTPRGERESGRPAHLDPAGDARREGRDPDPEHAVDDAVVAIARPVRRRTGGDPAAAHEQGRDHSLHRPDRVGQDDDALLLPAHDRRRGDQHRHGRGSGRIPARHQHRAGADQRENRVDLCGGVAIDPAAGPRHRAGRRNPRYRNGAGRRAGVAHRPPGAVDAAHQRRTEHGDAPGGHGARGVQDRRSAPRHHRAAIDAEALCVVPRQAADQRGARTAAELHSQGGDALESGRLRAMLSPNRVSRPLLGRRDPGGEPGDQSA